MVKNRTPISVDQEFLKQLKILQGKVLANGGDTSLRQLTETIANPKVFNEIEKKVLEIVKGENGINNIIRFDRRKP